VLARIRRHGGMVEVMRELLKHCRPPRHESDTTNAHRGMLRHPRRGSRTAATFEQALAGELDLLGRRIRGRPAGRGSCRHGGSNKTAGNLGFPRKPPRMDKLSRSTPAITRSSSTRTQQLVRDGRRVFSQAWSRDTLPSSSPQQSTLQQFSTI
jgi:hypothetical protein